MDNQCLLEKLAIVYNPVMKNSLEVLKMLEKMLVSRGFFYEKFSIEDLRKGFDFVFVIGGDGTLLRAARFYSHEFTPVFGINLGRLGFLSQTNESGLSEAIDKIFKNEYKVEDRIMLISDSGALALNDFVIKGASSTRTSRFYLSINDKFVCDYMADGLIIATPTGSTAYGLSAGGPVLTPNMDALIIVPICPHTLTARPLVVPSSEKISVSTSGMGPGFTVVSDGQNAYPVDTKVVIEKSQYCAKLALLDNEEFYSVLRAKLHWGVAPKG